MRKIPTVRFPAGLRRSRAAFLLPAILVSFIAAFAAGRSAFARTSPAAKVSEPPPVALPASLKIPSYAPGPIPLGNGETLVYEAYWVGIPAGEARMTLNRSPRNPGELVGQMWIKSSKAVDLVYRMRDYVREDFDRATLMPDGIYILQHEKQRLDHWRVTFDRPDHLVTSYKTNRQGRMWVRRFTGGDPFGPFSGALAALSQPMKVGETLTFDVFSGGNRYVFAFKIDGRDQITTPLGTFNALRIKPSVVWLSEGKLRSEARDATLWVTDDRRHLPLRIQSELFFGNLSADLVKVVAGQPFSTESAKGGANSSRATASSSSGSKLDPEVEENDSGNALVQPDP